MTNGIDLDGLRRIGGAAVDMGAYELVDTNYFMGRSPTILSNQCTYGSNAPEQTIQVWNTGTKEMAYTLSADVGWLSLSPVSGSSTGEIDFVSVNYASAGLAPGNYKGTVTVTSAQACNLPQVVMVYLSVLKLCQTIAFPAIPEQMVTSRVSLAATASSGLPVSFAVVSGPGMISGGNTLSFSAAGMVLVVARQAGDATYNPAPAVTNAVLVKRLSQTISFPAIPEQVVTSRVSLAATASSGLPVSFAVVSGPGRISSGTILTFWTTGTVWVAARQAGNQTYNPAPSVTNAVIVKRPPPATYHVSPAGNDANDGSSWALAKQTIQAAINKATSDDTVLVADGTYSPITIPQGITVRSVNGAQTTIIDGGGVTRCVSMYGDAVLDGFTVTNGYDHYSGGGVYVYRGTVQNCTISGNSAYYYYSYSNSSYYYSYYYGYGGGVYAYYGTVTNCTISGNSAGSDGGGIYTYASTIYNCTISGNTAYSHYNYYYSYDYYSYYSDGYQGYGGGVYAQGGTLTDCAITGNTAGDGGGGIYSSGSTIQNCTISSNSANSYYYSYYSGYYDYDYDGYRGYGGGVYNYYGMVTNCTIAGNSAGSGGGGIYTYASTIQNCSISGNAAYSYYSSSNSSYSYSHYQGYGGGVYAYDGTLADCTISENTAGYGGGGIYSSGSTIQNCTISGNMAYSDYNYSYSSYYYSYNYDGYQGYGGGVYAQGGTLADCTISENTVGEGGGGIYNSGSTIRNCTISSNSASSYYYSYYSGYYDYDYDGYRGYGGGVYNYYGTVANCTIKGNSVSNLGGGVYAYYGTVTNCAITGNTAGDGGGGLYAGYYCFITDCSIRENLSYSSGGGIFSYGNTIEHCTISSNTAHTDGGGLFLSWGNTVKHCTISSNTAFGNGGGLQQGPGNTVQNCALSYNGATWGGGAVLWLGGILQDCTIDGNWASYGGGGALNVRGTVQDCVITGNRTLLAEHPELVITYGSCGGGVLAWQGTVQRCLIANNWTADFGGGVYAVQGMIQNCVINRNGAAFDGGGVEIWNSTLRNCLIAGNAANDFGGGLYSSNSIVQNCTISGNEANEGGGLYSSGGNTIQNCIAYYNQNGDVRGILSGISYSCFGTQIAGSGNISSEPQFVAKGSDYGTGHVPGNYRLQSISPCINVGLNQSWMANAVDLDGRSRIWSAVVDMGAYEFYSLSGIVQFNPAIYSVNEGNGSVTLTATRTGGSFGPASVDYTTADATAISGLDYTFQSGTLSWLDGEAGNKTITIPISDDSLDETDETFTATLNNATGAGLGSLNLASVTIVDNDATPEPGTIQFGASSYSVRENGGTVTLTVTRTGGHDGPATVAYATAAGTALAGQDYTSQSGTLSWPDGDSSSKTITVPITDDTIDESDETFTMTLSNATGASLGSPNVATVTIVDNDIPPDPEDLADLEVSDFKFVPVNLWAGDHPAMISFEMVNGGPAALVASDTQLEISFYLSANQTFGDADDIAIGTKTEALTLAASSQTTIRYPGRAHNEDVTIPEGLSGDFYVFVSVSLVSSAGLTDPDGASAMREGPIRVRIHPSDDDDDNGEDDGEDDDKGNGGNKARSVVNDFDGDEVSDMMVYDEPSGNWSVQLSALGKEVRFGFGGVGYEAVPGDYDGDGLADPAIHNRQGAAWSILLSGRGYAAVNFDFGGSGKTRGTVGNYTGASRANPGLYEETSGRWYVMLSEPGSGSAEIASAVFGGNGYLPVAGDYDGDGRTDPAVYGEETGQWMVMLSAQGYGVVSAIFGGPGYEPVVGDYDGDGKADPMLYEQATGTWQGLMSASGYVLKRFSSSAGVPVAGDYDGDGLADPTVLDSSGNWSFLSSASSYLRAGPYTLAAP
ncbi:MAG: right-handed parallel beta-helix repeat-containing protein [Lentisphaerae bacterium]|nr:right-handed parallel beta-helix repeat-containing protein [Lentisphaerota bacterium]